MADEVRREVDSPNGSGGRRLAAESVAPSEQGEEKQVEDKVPRKFRALIRTRTSAARSTSLRDGDHRTLRNVFSFSRMLSSKSRRKLGPNLAEAVAEEGKQG